MVSHKMINYKHTIPYIKAKYIQTIIYLKKIETLKSMIIVSYGVGGTYKTYKI